jgi:selenocysteine-specific elongation factor
MIPVQEFIGKMHTVSKLPLKISNRSNIHAYVGTAERTGRIIWFENHKFLKEEQTYHVRVKLDTPVAAVSNDAFLIRLHSPVITLAGGKILEINPDKISHKKEEWKAHFSVMAEGNLSDKIETIIKKSHLKSVSYQKLQHKLFQHLELIQSHIQELLVKKKIRQIEIKAQQHFIHETNFDQLVSEIEAFIRQFHTKNPLKAGLNQQELETGMGRDWIAAEIIQAALNNLINSNKIKNVHNRLSLVDFEIKVSKDTDQAISNILDIFQNARFAPPNQSELAAELEMSLQEIQSLTSMLANQKKLILINRQFYLHHNIWNELINYLRKYFSQHSEMPVAALKDFIQTTRKFAIPLFEFLDAEGYTQRTGDVRKQGSRL